MGIAGSGRLWAWRLLTVASVGLYVGCSNGDQSPGEAEVSANAASSAEEVTPAYTAGSVTFVTSTGGARSFEFIDSDASYLTRVASMLVARPEPGATEQILLVFMGIDLKELDLPAELPPPPSSPPSIRPISIAISYTDASGTEWSGPSRIRVVSLGADGIVEGTFLEAVLPHTERREPDLVLTEGRFRGRLAPPF